MFIFVIWGGGAKAMLLIISNVQKLSDIYYTLLDPELVYGGLRVTITSISNKGKRLIYRRDSQATPTYQ